MGPPCTHSSSGAGASADAVRGQHEPAADAGAVVGGRPDLRQPSGQRQRASRAGEPLGFLPFGSLQPDRGSGRTTASRLTATELPPVLVAVTWHWSALPFVGRDRVELYSLPVAPSIGTPFRSHW